MMMHEEPGKGTGSRGILSSFANPPADWQGWLGGLAVPPGELLGMHGRLRETVLHVPTCSSVFCLIVLCYFLLPHIIMTVVAHTIAYIS